MARSPKNHGFQETSESPSVGTSREIGPSKWKIAKRHARLSILSAVSKIMGTSSLERKDLPGIEPQVLVGPVIGKVTSTTARILIEIDQPGVVTVILQESLVTTPGQKGQTSNGPAKQQRHRPHVKRALKELEAMRPGVFQFSDLKPAVKYNVELKGCKSSITSSFWTFPGVPADTVNVGVISCNKIFITQQAIPIHSDLWAHLAKSVESGKIDMLVHLGDQIYGDGDKRQDAEAGADQDKWSDRFRVGKAMLEGVLRDQWKMKQEAICEKYREVYRDTWQHPPTAKCLANCPNFMIYDDHEVRDNWGDVPEDWDAESLEFFVARCAWIVNLEYQRQLHVDVDFSKLNEINKDYHLHVVGGVGLMFLDIRGSRTFHRIKGDDKPYLGSLQWGDIKESLGSGGLFDEVHALLICSPAPLVFLEPNITNTAANTVHRLEDFKGHWSARLHMKEQLQMIQCLLNWKSARSRREVLFLGGDVHCGGHSDILKNHRVVFRQLTTSAIANMPLPRSAYYFMRAAGRVGRLDQEYAFKHHHWTRARNYGLVQVKSHHPEDHHDKEVEHKDVEVSAQLVIGKFMSGVKYGDIIYNTIPTPRKWCASRYCVYPDWWWRYYKAKLRGFFHVYDV